jgi:hypothetical protein
MCNIVLLSCAVGIIAAILHCPDTSSVDRLLGGDTSIALEKYSIVDGEDETAVTDRRSVEYMKSQFAKSTNIGYVRTKVTKHSHSIVIRLFLAGADRYDLPASIVERDGATGLLVSYNLNCNHDHFYYWIPLAVPVDKILHGTIARIHLTNT